jgi:hypothetical protein
MVIKIITTINLKIILTIIIADKLINYELANYQAKLTIIIITNALKI